MKVLSLLPLAFVASALVIPDAQIIESLQQLENQEKESHPFWDNIKDPSNVWNELEDKFERAAKCAKHKFAHAADQLHETAVEYSEDFQTAFAGKSWLDAVNDDKDHPPPPPHGSPKDKPPHHGPPPPHHGPPKDGPPHHGPPHDGPPHHKPPHHGPPHDGPPHHGPPHHGPPHHKSNLTVYQLIAESKYTTYLAKAISEFPDLVQVLNSTNASCTVFAPTDSAFEKIPKGAPKPSKEFLKKLLSYHVSPEFYPAGRILVSRTIPTALGAEFIDDNPQRLSTNIGLRGLTINFYSRVVAPNIFGSNGVIHGIDSILLPPPKAVEILQLLPTEFSTLELALTKTGLLEAFNNTDLHVGGTLFAPSNFAFARLGPRINAFLFSKYGEKYLKALVLYHAGRDITLYSDAIYKPKKSESSSIPRGAFHIDLPTGLMDKELSVDVGRFGRLITIRINGFTDATVLDGIAADGVVHLVSRVLIPPREPGGLGYVTDEMSLEDLQERLEPFVEADDVYDWEL